MRIGLRFDGGLQFQLALDGLLAQSILILKLWKAIWVCVVLVVYDHVRTNAKLAVPGFPVKEVNSLKIFTDFALSLLQNYRFTTRFRLPVFWDSVWLLTAHRLRSFDKPNWHRNVFSLTKFTPRVVLREHL